MHLEHVARKRHVGGIEDSQIAFGVARRHHAAPHETVGRPRNVENAGFERAYRPDCDVAVAHHERLVADRAHFTPDQLFLVFEFTHALEPDATTEVDRHAGG